LGKRRRKIGFVGFLQVKKAVFSKNLVFFWGSLLFVWKKILTLPYPSNIDMCIAQEEQRLSLFLKIGRMFRNARKNKTKF
jgi:hypothetical protein